MCRRLFLMLVVATTCSLAAPAWSDGAEILSTRAAYAAVARVEPTASLVELVYEIATIYDVPINTEMSPEVVVAGVEGVSLQIRANETLGNALSRLPEAFTTHFLIERISDQVVVRPRTADLGPLDHELDLTLESVTTWQAVKAILGEANRSGLLDEPFAVAMQGTYFMSSHRTPKAFTEQVLETPFVFERATVRDALCAVFRESPIKLSYSYYPASGSGGFVTLTIKFPRGVKADIPPTSDEMEWWNNETQEVFDAFVPK